jgi:hypothetical protein
MRSPKRFNYTQSKISSKREELEENGQTEELAQPFTKELPAGEQGKKHSEEDGQDDEEGFGPRGG